jgi:hypothetical protein
MKELDETSRVIAAGDGAHLQQAIESVDWERRGLLQRLVRAGSRDEATARPRGM